MTKNRNAKSTAKANVRQWLNLMIFLVSAMFLFAMLIGRLLDNSPLTSDSSSVNELAIALELQQKGLIYRLQFSDYEVSFENQKWTSSHPQLPQAQLEKLAARWQALVTQVGEPFITQNSAISKVLLRVTGLDRPLVAHIYQSQDRVYIYFVDTKTAVQIALKDLTLFHPQNAELTDQLKNIE